MDEIKYTTPSEQIEKLKSQNMIIHNEIYAKEQLRQCGYSNLIKSYREPYTLISNEKKYIDLESLLSKYNHYTL